MGVKVKFTDTELELIRLLAQGDQVDEIATKTHLARTYVNQLKYVLFAKVGARNTAHLISIAYQNKLLT